MSITFGSVGDIIAVSLIIKDLIGALSKSRGSSAEYQAVVAELLSFERALTEVDKLSQRCSGTVELNALFHTTKVIVDRCSASIQAFSERVKKYDDHLSTAASQSSPVGKLKAVGMKLRWQIKEKDELERFRAEIAASSASINMLLATATAVLAHAGEETVSKTLKQTERENKTSQEKQEKILQRIHCTTSETKNLLSSATSAISRIEHTLGWFRNLGLELKGFVETIVKINMATYKVVVSLQALIPNFSDRILFQQYFVLEDAIGRTAPVHLQFINSWDAFDAVLEARFRDRPGLPQVQAKEYTLQEKDTVYEIDRERCWEASFLPGQHIEMSLIFKHEEEEDRDVTSADCPRCRKSSASSKAQDTQVTCNYCGLTFRRITEIYDQEESQTATEQIHQVAAVKFGQPSLVIRPVPPAPTVRKRKTNASVNDIRPFKRVRIVTRRKHTVIPARGFRSSAHTTVTFSDGGETASPNRSPWSQSVHHKANFDSSEFGSPEALVSMFAPRPEEDDAPSTELLPTPADSLVADLRDDYSTISYEDSYVLENGRQYHSYRDGGKYLHLITEKRLTVYPAYFCPRDQAEIDRLDLIHAMCTKILDQLFMAPVAISDGKIVDLGTGSGAWAIDMADTYPSATVLGRDLSGSQPEWVPPNCKFEIDDIENEWPDEKLSSFIFLRNLACCIADWPKLISEAYKFTAPGGWIEFQDFDYNFYSLDNTLTEEHELRKWCSKLLEASALNGRDPRPALQMKRYLEAAGFTKVHCEKLVVPVGSWPKAVNKKEIGIFNMMSLTDGGIEAMSLRLFTKVLGMTPEAVTEQAEAVKMELKQRVYHAVQDFHVVYAQKPSA